MMNTISIAQRFGESLDRTLRSGVLTIGSCSNNLAGIAGLHYVFFMRCTPGVINVTITHTFPLLPRGFGEWQKMLPTVEVTVEQALGSQAGVPTGEEIKVQE